MPARKAAKNQQENNEVGDGRKRKQVDDLSVFDFSSPGGSPPCRAVKKRVKPREEPPTQASQHPPAALSSGGTSLCSQTGLGRRRAVAASGGSDVVSDGRAVSPRRQGRTCIADTFPSQPPPIEAVRCTALHVRSTAVLLHDFVLMVEPDSLTALVPSPKHPHAISSSADARPEVTRLVLHRSNITRIGFTRPREGMSWVLMICLRDDVHTVHHGMASELTFELKRSARTSSTLPQDAMLALLTSYFRPPSKSASTIHPDDVNVRALQVVAARRENEERALRSQLQILRGEDLDDVPTEEIEEIRGCLWEALSAACAEQEARRQRGKVELVM